MLLAGKSIIITGAAGGIGRAAALITARQGAVVTVADMFTEGGQETVALILAGGGKASFIKTDVGDEEQVRALVEQVVAATGSLHGAFNNAGVEAANLPLHETPVAEWHRVIGIDLTGVFLCMKYQIAAMLKTGGGAIVNTASVLGEVGKANASAYVAAKHGVVGLTRTAAAEYSALGIRVNAVLPGAITTPMIERLDLDPAFAERLAVTRAAHPIGRMGKPAEIGEAAAWLLSDAASFVTGAILPVDGGYLAV